jgi:hypothetical protein
MAIRVDNVDFKRHSRAKYNWTEWADGSTWQIQYGEDFSCSTASMKGHIYSHAFKNDKKVRVRQIDDQTLAFQFYAPEQD